MNYLTLQYKGIYPWISEETSLGGKNKLIGNVLGFSS